MLGDTNAGKTSLVLRFAEGYYRQAPRAATVGAFFITKRIQTSGGITCKVQIWDTAGQEQFRCMAPMYYKNAAAAIVCYEVTSRRSFDVMKEWLEELHRNVPAGSIVLFIAANKSDLIPSSDKSSLVSPKEGEDLAAEMGAIYMDTSAKTNDNVEELFRRVSERVLQIREISKQSWLNSGSIQVTPGKTVDQAGKMVRDGAAPAPPMMNGRRMELNGDGDHDDSGILANDTKGIENEGRVELGGVGSCDPLGSCGVLSESDAGRKCVIQ